MAPQIPAPPRPPTPSARRKSWTEPRVRFWLLTGMLLFAIAISFIADGWFVWRTQASLIRNGIPVEAEISGVRLPMQYVHVAGKTTDPSYPITLRFDWQGAQYNTQQNLAEGYRGSLTVGQTLRVRVDPENPERWTVREEVGPISDYVLGGLLVLPVSIVVLGVAAFLRRRTLGLWRTGTEIEAVAIENRNTPLAPRSRWVSCTPLDPQDLRVFSVYVPKSSAVSHEGHLTILAMPGSTTAVAAQWLL